MDSWYSSASFMALMTNVDSSSLISMRSVISSRSVCKGSGHGQAEEALAALQAQPRQAEPPQRGAGDALAPTPSVALDSRLSCPLWTRLPWWADTTGPHRAYIPGEQTPGLGSPGR